MPYPEEEYLRDKERILQALDELHALQTKYRDIIAIPEVISLHDIADYRLQTKHGIQQFQAVFSKQDAEFVLQQFAGTDIITPERFEDIIVYALATIQQGLT